MHTSWRPVILDPFSFAVTPGTGDVVTLGNPPLKVLGIDVYDSLGKCASVLVKGVGTASFKQCH